MSYRKWSRSLRWAGAPLGWRGFGYRAARRQAIARRTRDVALARTRAHGAAVGARERRLIGYLFREPGPRRMEVVAARHPVLDDQYVTASATEATNLGYEDTVRLGYAVAVAPVTGVLGGRRPGRIPWASRFGLS